MPYPSTCPECGTFLDHTSSFPGSPDGTVTLDCPECAYREHFEDPSGT